jgi:hypothetical protein
MRAAFWRPVPCCGPRHDGDLRRRRHNPGRHARRRASAGAPSSLKLLDVKDVKVGNFLPAVVIAPGLVDVASLFR